MCQPKYFEIKYQINPWMQGKINKSLAIKQWLNLKKEIEQFLQIKVEEIQPRQNLPDMVFTTDSAIIHKNKAVCANFKYRQRQKESFILAEFLKQKGFKTLKISDNYCFEGGDFLFWQNYLLCGYGFRTDLAAHKIIAQIFEKTPISLKLINPYLYHLDTALFPVGNKLFFYPQAFDPSSIEKIKNLGQTQAINRADALALGLNSLSFGKKIIANSLSNGCLNCLTSEGFKIKKLDISEFLKSGGGIHCLACQIN